MICGKIKNEKFDRYKIQFNDIKRNIEIKNKIKANGHLEEDVEFKRRKREIEKA